HGFKGRQDIIYVRGDDWEEFPGRQVLEDEEVPIHFQKYSAWVSSTLLRHEVQKQATQVYRALVDEAVTDEQVIPLLEDAIFAPSDAVMRLVYDWLYHEGRQDLFADRFVRLSRLVGTLWSRPESQHLVARFVEIMGVDTSEITRPIQDFGSLNEFFYRPVDLTQRPFEEMGGPKPGTVTSPGDGLVLVYSNAETAKRCFLKGKRFNLANLLDHNSEQISLVEGGPVVVVRLQPHNIHRFYAPLDSTMGEPVLAGTHLHTVKSHIVGRDDVNVFTDNIRQIVTFRNSTLGTYILVAIGAPLIGAVRWSVEPNCSVGNGEELGYFEYGGSTVLLLFPPQPSIDWKFPIDRGHEDELEVQIHQTIGTI
ncbi:MAG: hypothetical protein HN348_27225, partial [Proteobacteria bacterium]|nr:hypothetical protein [Pseudomonadota bacterium]